MSVLGDAATAEAVPLLAQLAKDSDIRIRRSALQALGRRREQAALLVLRDNLADKEPQIRMEAIRSLGKFLGAAPLPGEQSRRTDAAQWLRTFFDHATMSEQALVSDILAKLGDKTHSAKVHAMAASTDPELRRSFAESSTAGADELGRSLEDPVFAVRLAAAKQMAKNGDHRAVEVLHDALKRGGADAVTAYAMLVRLGETPAAPAELGQTLTAPEMDKRLAAVSALSTLPPEVALPLLLRAARDPDAQVRSQVAAAAASLPSKEGLAAGSPLWQLLLTDRDAAVRARAQVLLARSADSPTPVAEPDIVDEPHAAPDLNPADAATTIDLGHSAPPAELPGAVETPTKSEPAKSESGKAEAAKPEPGSESATEPAVKADGETDAAAPEATAALTIEAEPGTLYQLDHHAWQAVAAQPIMVVPGAHHLGSLSGPQDFTAVAQKPVTVHLATSRVERLSHAAQESFHHADYRKAQRQLEQALSLCSQDHKNAAPCAILALDMTVPPGSGARPAERVAPKR